MINENLKLPSQEDHAKHMQEAEQWLNQNKERLEHLYDFFRKARANAAVGMNGLARVPSMIIPTFAFASLGFDLILQGFEQRDPGWVNRPKILDPSGRPLN